MEVNPFTPDIAIPKLLNFPKLQTQQLSNEWSHFRVLYMESKVRKLCITQGFTLGVKGLKKQHHSKVLLNSFPMSGHTLGFCP